MVLLISFNLRLYGLKPKVSNFAHVIIGLVNLILPVYFVVLECIIMLKNPRKYFSNVLIMFRVTP